MNVALDGTVAPGVLESSKESSFVPAQVLSEVDEWSGGSGVAPGRLGCGVALADDAEELTRQSGALGNLWRTLVEFIQIAAGLFGLLEQPPSDLSRGGARRRRKGRRLSAPASTRAEMFSDPRPNDARSSGKALRVQLVPELGAVVASLLPAQLQILVEWIEGRGTLGLFAFRKALSANPAAHRLSVQTELACGPLLGRALSDLLHHRFIAHQAAFPVLLLHLPGRSRRFDCGRWLLASRLRRGLCIRILGDFSRHFAEQTMMRP